MEQIISSTEPTKMLRTFLSHISLYLNGCQVSTTFKVYNGKEGGPWRQAASDQFLTLPLTSYLYLE